MASSNPDMLDLAPVTPLSPVQTAMLRVSMGGAGGANIEQVEVDFAAGLPMDRVASAWAATVERTQALRMGFVIRDGEPCGVHPLTITAPLHMEAENPDSWEDWLAADRLRPLALADGLPWRAVFWPGARKLVWTFHHALLDGRAITKILQAFQARLAGAEDPGDLELSPAAPATSAETANAADFHARTFAEIESCEPEFPADKENTPTAVSRCLGQEIAARLDSAAEHLEVSAPALVTWAWGQALACAAGADAVIVGQVRSGAPRPGQAGFSMNTVPLGIRRAVAGPAKPLLQEFRRHLLEMRSVENVSPQELPASVFHGAPGPWPGGVVMVERGTLHHQVGKSDAIDSITLHEHSGEPLLASAHIHPDLHLEIETNGDRCGPRMAECLLDHWAAIITALADEISTDAEVLIGLPAPMCESLTLWESGGEAAAHLHLAEAWRNSAREFAARPALWAAERPVTYAELAAQVEHLAARLHEAGITSGVTVSSILWDRKHLAVVLLALARLGAIHVPLDPALPEQRLRAIVADAGPVLLLSDDPAACADIALPCLPIDGMSGKTCAADFPADPTETLAILYTSGSTGQPKGVMMVHGGVVNEAIGMAGLAGIGPDGIVLQYASPGFDASLEELLATLLSGAMLAPRPERLAADLDQFHSFIRETRITVLDLSTAHWAAWCAWMVSENETVPEHVRTTIIGGERASAAAVKDWFAAGGGNHLLVNTYGPTEASIVGTAELIRRDWCESGDPAIGRPLPGVFARVGDASGRRLPPGAAGELWLGGICVGGGYWQRPDLTRDAFRAMDGLSWYRTGDRVCWDSEGKLRFLGRRDDQLKIRGNRVEPNEVIRVLESFPGVSAAHAGPVLGHGGFIQLAAWIRWNQAPVDGWPHQLAAYAAIHLPNASIPTRWAAVGGFQLTERGKLDRRQLPEPLLTASAHTTSGPPATPTEKRLAILWSELLEIPAIGRDESFFELGGHSLAALQLFAGIAREWNVRIPMATLIQSSTLRLLGELIDRETATRDLSKPRRAAVVPVRAEGHLPPLFCIHGGDGGVIFYRNLADQLPPDRPLLAIESPILATTEEVRPVPVEVTAALYIKALREHQPQGPFHLAGYSYGGLLVYEMARLLIADGETVAFAGMFDTVNPAAPIREYSLIERAEVFWASQEDQRLIPKLRRLVERTREGIATHLKIKGETRAARGAGATAPHTGIRMLQIREAHWESMTNYKPQPLAGHVTLFKSLATDDKFDIPYDYGWTGLVKSIEIVVIPGEHLSMFEPGCVETLAEEVAKRLPIPNALVSNA